MSSTPEEIPPKYPNKPYSATLFDKDGELGVKADVNNTHKERTVEQSIAENHEVHIYIGRTPKDGTKELTLKQVGALMAKIGPDIKFSVEATCIGEP